ncbi:uncharacterized protein isoform X1 [Leptinotarsa decemlineata]|uniref:uncharacterized protein isoform X1 n=1 Tax=Leptinotarsa decemlineata TaxID=7539 RepID=UPI003D304F27
MRLRVFERPILVSLLIIKIIVIYLTFFLKQNTFWNPKVEVSTKTIPVTKPLTKHISKQITIVIREFELYENDVTLTAHSFINLFPNIQVFILYDELPYPPLDIIFTNNSLANVKFVKLSPNLRGSFSDQYPLISLIKTKYVLFLPDSTRASSRQSLQIMINELNKVPGQVVVATVNNRKKYPDCLRINVNIREWTLKLSLVKNMQCDGISGKHAMLVETDTLKRLSNAFFLPFPYSLYIQTAALDIEGSDTSSAGSSRSLPRLSSTSTSRLLQRKLEARIEHAKRLHQDYNSTPGLIPIQRLPIPGAKDQQPLVQWDTDDSEEDIVNFFPLARKESRIHHELTDTFSIEEMSISGDDEEEDLHLVPPTTFYKNIKCCSSSCCAIM